MFRLIASRLLAVAVIAFPVAASAQATAIWTQYGTATPTFLQAPNVAVTLRSSIDRMDVIFGTGSEGRSVGLAVPTGQTLVPGVYDHATYYNNVSTTTASRLGIGDGSGPFSGCNYASARFTVLESVFDAGQVIRFAANYELTCSYDVNVNYGEVRINSTVPITAQRGAGWTKPDPFAFPTRMFVTPGSEVVSESGRIYGITGAAPISISNGQYSVNSGPFTSAAGTVSNRDQVRVLVTAPAGLNDAASAQVNVGGTLATFTASTPTTGSVISGLRLEGSAGDPLLAGTSVTVVSPEWRVDTYGLSIRFSDLLRSYDVQVRANPKEVGAYEGKPSYDPGNPGINVSVTDAFGFSHGCHASEKDRFVVLEVAGYVPDFSRLALDFEMYCNGTPVFGELRINSSWPFTFEKPAGATSPDAFAFRSASPQMPGVLVQSSSTTIYGINAPAAIQVAGGEYSVNNGGFTSAAGTIGNKDHVRVRGIAPATAGTAATVTLTVGGKSAAFEIPTYGQGIPLTSLHLEGGLAFDGTSPDMTLTQSSNGSFFVGAPATNSFNIYFSPPPNRAFAPGTFEDLKEDSSTARVSIYVSSCIRTGARLVVLEASYAQDNLERFAADFQVFCANSPDVFGEIRFNSTIPSMRFVAPGASLPEPFTFIGVPIAQAGRTYTSNRVGIYGINVAVPISVTSGEYSLNGGPFTSAAGVAHSGDDVVVRVMASLSSGATRTATLNVGGRMANFDVTTYMTGAAVTSLIFSSVQADPIAHGASGRFTSPTPNEITSWVGGSGIASAVNVNARDTDGYTTSLYIAAASGQSLQVGAYPDAAISNSEGVKPIVQFSYRGIGCANGGPASFTILDLGIFNGIITSFAADFELHCGGSGSLKGQVRINSLIPSDAFPIPPIAARRGFDANGDGRNDILFANTDGTTALWLMDGPSQVGGGTLLPAATGWSIAGQGDFNGDGKSDVLWKHTDGRVAMWLMNGSTQIGGGILLPAGTGWLPKLVGDFNGDGKADILWENSDGSSALWIMDGFSQVGGGRLFAGGTGWLAKLLGDLNGDGKADIIWTHTDGRTAVWIMNGSQQVGGAVLITAGLGWSPKLAIDVDGDGKADLVWLNADGKSAVWLMNGTVQRGGGILMNSGSAYIPVLGGDIDGDGKADIVWRAADGTTIFWLMNGAAQAGGGQILAASSGWTVTRVADFSGDIIGDLLLVHTDGRVQMRLFDGLGFTSTATLLDAGTTWAPVPIQ